MQLIELEMAEKTSKTVSLLERNLERERFITIIGQMIALMVDIISTMGGCGIIH